MSKTEAYSFYIPKIQMLGADGFVIPKNSKNPELAKNSLSL